MAGGAEHGLYGLPGSMDPVSGHAGEFREPAPQPAAQCQPRVLLASSASTGATHHPRAPAAVRDNTKSLTRNKAAITRRRCGAVRIQSGGVTNRRNRFKTRGIARSMSDSVSSSAAVPAPATPTPAGPAPAAPIAAEAVIIGAGPVGLFQIFELGLLGIKAHIIDSLAQAGGQCTELYPEKPIYDIPALPVCGAQELIDRLMEQAKPFHATFHLGEEVTEVRHEADGKIHVGTSAGTQLIAGAVVIAGGLGSFQPRRLAVPGIEAFEGKQVHYRIKSSADFHGQDLVICGGGDSALDWTVALCDKARSLSLVHRRAEFRAAPATVARMRELVAAGKMQLLEGNLVAHEAQDHKLVGVEIQANDGRRRATAGASKCSPSSACTRSSARSPIGVSSWKKKRSRWTPRNFRRACPAFSRSATSTPIRARRS